MKQVVLTTIIIFALLCSLVAGLQLLSLTEASKVITVPNDYSTIQLAIDKAASEDTIFVKNGIYLENVVVNKSVNLIGEDKQLTIIDGNNLGPALIISAQNVNVTGFAVKNAPTLPSYSRNRLAAIHLLNAHNCSIYYNTLYDSGKGIWIVNSHNNTVSNNYMYSNNYGILIQESSGNLIVNNCVTDGWVGIFLDVSKENTLQSNSMLNNHFNFGVSGLTVSHYLNYVDSSNMVGTKKVYYLINQSNIDINPISFPDLGSLIVVNCTNVQIKNLTITNTRGIHIVNAPNVWVVNNTISNTNGGIWIQFSPNSFIADNILSDISEWAIQIDGSENTIVVNNTILAVNLTRRHNEHGIWILNSSWSIIAENNIVEYSKEDAENFGICIQLSNFCQIFNNQIINCSHSGGLTFEQSSNNIAQANNIAMGNQFFYSSPAINIGSNSNNNTLWANILTAESVQTGIRIASSSNQIIGNNITGFWQALKLSGISDNLITENTLRSKNQIFYIVGDTINNLIYRNNFEKPTLVDDLIGMSCNFWDNGTVGNYWGDYTGDDLNGDGIGDIPYVVHNNVVDNYPLINKVTPTTPSPLSWKNITQPQPTQMPTIPSPSPSPAISPVKQPTLNPALTPPTSIIPEDYVKDYSLVIVIIILAILTAVMSLMIYFKKRIATQ
ncbi:MAG: Periplasmic copper-binding protein (NosD) [Bacteroidetes bacterium ADurb.Bin302]|nr:MAG: Periplasmic copper-binding protein (NosD) [Bacteroidetes bacterium ADurb.Bin302]